MFKRALITATAMIMTAQAATAETRVVVDSVPSPEEFAHILGIELPQKPKTKLRLRGIKMHAEPQTAPTPAEVEAQIQSKWDVAEVAEAPALPEPKITSNYETKVAAASTTQPVYSVKRLTTTKTAPNNSPHAVSRVIATPVNFALDSSEIPANFEGYLDNLAVVLKAPDAEKRILVIAGHTDSIGAEDYNYSLSSRRASAVEAYLMERGVKQHQLISVGRGETQLIKGREADHAINRRVEFRIAG